MPRLTRRRSLRSVGRDIRRRPSPWNASWTVWRASCASIGRRCAVAILFRRRRCLIRSRSRRAPVLPCATTAAIIPPARHRPCRPQVGKIFRSDRRRRDAKAATSASGLRTESRAPGAGRSNRVWSACRIRGACRCSPAPPRLARGCARRSRRFVRMSSDCGPRTSLSCQGTPQACRSGSALLRAGKP